MALTMLSLLFGCGGKSKQTVTSVESMTLTVRGMRGGYVYEIVNDADRTALRRSREVYNGEETLLEPEAIAECAMETFIELMNTYGVIRWDGFHGKHPRNVQDGIMFVFTASVNGGHSVYADGSANFPKGYNEFVRALDTMLAESDAAIQKQENQ